MLDVIIYGRFNFLILDLIEISEKIDTSNDITDYQRTMLLYFIVLDGIYYEYISLQNKLDMMFVEMSKFSS